MSRTTFTGWKRRIGVGTKLLCVEQTHQPKLIGQTRVVNKVGATYIRTDPLVKSCNPNHLVGSGWIAMPGGTSLDEAQAARIFEACGAWQVREVAA